MAQNAQWAVNRPSRSWAAPSAIPSRQSRMRSSTRPRRFGERSSAASAPGSAARTPAASSRKSPPRPGSWNRGVRRNQRRKAPAAGRATSQSGTTPTTQTPVTLTTFSFQSPPHAFTPRLHCGSRRTGSSCGRADAWRLRAIRAQLWPRRDRVRSDRSRGGRSAERRRCPRRQGGDGPVRLSRLRNLAARMAPRADSRERLATVERL
jgi:hypothetical protein